MKPALFLGVFLALPTTTSIATPLFAQPSLVEPSSARVIASAPTVNTDLSKDLSIDNYGYIRDYGTLLGQIDSNGYVRDSNGRIMGKLDGNGYIRDADDAIIGQFDSSGYIRDGEGRIVGRLEDDGTLRNADGGVITWGPIDRPLAAFLLFFQ